MHRYSTDWDRHLVAGEWTQGRGDEYTNTNPFDDASIATIKLATERDVEDAYKAAERAQKRWARTNPTQKSEVLEKVAQIMEESREHIVSLLAQESGSTLIKANIEVDNAIAILKESASFPMRISGEILPSPTPGKESRVYREPVGVIGVISPWNFPLHLAMRSVAPAIACGNAVVLKPATQTYISGGLLLGKLFEEAGLQPGVLNVLVGSGSEIGDAMVTHDVPSVISFTGSTPVGKRIGEKAGGRLKKLALELGGNNAMIVLDDANLHDAADAAVFGSYLHQGQICIALNRVLVHQSMYEDFVDAVKMRVERLKSGDPTKEGVFIGPVISDDQKEKILDIVRKSEEQGARKVLGGETANRVLEPILLADVTAQMSAFTEEVFGPVCSIIKYETEEEAVELANATSYGLSGSVYGGDINRATHVARQIKTGMVHVNDQSVNDDPNAAFGGVGDSGIGRFGGSWAMHEFTRERWLTVQHEQRSYPIISDLEV